MNQKAEIIIVGSGPAGLGLAAKMEKPGIILEAESSIGGLMRSKKINGYIFDWAGHIFFTRIARIQHLVDSILGDMFHYQDRESWVFSKHTYTRYPFQGNTFGLPVPVVKECLMGLIEASFRSQSKEPCNFKEWIFDTYGEGIARHFMIPYNCKLWARDLSEMDHHWLADRVPRPSLSDFIDGALGPGRKDMGPNARFGYPLEGGMQTLAERLGAMIRHPVLTGERVISIHPADRLVTTSSGTSYPYSHLVLTCPLHEAVGMTQNAPDDLRDCVSSLKHLSVLCVNVGIGRPAVTEKHWVYFPEPDFLFHRVFVQGNAAPGVCPPGCFSYTAEITYSEDKNVDFTSAGDRTVNGLIQAGLMRKNDRIDVIDLIDIPVAYIVPTHNRQAAVEKVRNWFQERNIHLAGRFAEWEYYNMDHSIDAGWRLAEELNQL
jgi:UDP-galactopyranose mutase